MILQPIGYLLVALLLGLTGYGQTTDSMALNKAVLYYYSYGQGEPLVILSGGPGVGSHQEEDVAIELGKHYRAILFDQRGTGRSWTKPVDSTTINLDQAVDDLDRLRQQLHRTTLNLYGHSWGSMLAAAYIAKFPDRVSLFISVGGGELDASLSQTVTDNQNARMQLAEYQHWTDSVTIKKDSAKAAYELRKLRLRRSVYDPTKLATYMKQIVRGERNPLMARLMWQSIRKKLHLIEGCKAYSGPALVVYGWNDMIGLTTSSQYIEAFPKAQVHRIDECGHYPELEQPGQFYPLILDFLKQSIKSN